MSPCCLLLLILYIFGSSNANKKVVKEKVSVKQSRDSELVTSGSYSLDVYHAFGVGSEFTYRGSIQLKSLKSSSSVTFTQEPLNPQQLKQFRTTTVLRNSTTDDIIDNEPITSQKDSSDTVTTFVSACTLLKSGLKDKLVVHGNGKGSITGLMLLPLVATETNEFDCQEISSSASYFTSTVEYSNGVTGPIPETQKYLQKIEAERAKKENEDNRSFFQKYWLYIVIGLVAVQFIGLGGGGGGASGGGAAS